MKAMIEEKTAIVKVHECYGRDQQEAEIGITSEIAEEKAVARFGQTDLNEISKVRLSTTEIQGLVIEGIDYIQSDLASYINPSESKTESEALNDVIGVIDNVSFLSCISALKAASATLTQTDKCFPSGDI